MTFLCRLNWHRWSKWTVAAEGPMVDELRDVAGKVKKSRTGIYVTLQRDCLRCGLVELQRKVG
jgi:hypothetical protein